MHLLLCACVRFKRYISILTLVLFLLLMLCFEAVSIFVYAALRNWTWCSYIIICLAILLLLET